jgi:hypothetical protein
MLFFCYSVLLGESLKSSGGDDFLISHFYIATQLANSIEKFYFTFKNKSNSNTIFHFKKIMFCYKLQVILRQEIFRGK